MKAGKIVAGLLVCACVALVFIFTLRNLLDGGSFLNSASENAALASADVSEASTEASDDAVASAETASTEEASTEEASTEEASTMATAELPELEGYDPNAPSFDTMGDGTVPADKEDYIVESTKDFAQFWDNGKENYIAFKNFIIKKTYKNTQDMVCDYFVDLAFKDGSSLEGLRCNNVTALEVGNRYRYGYVRDDATQQNGQNVMYLYLVQE